MQDFRNPKLPLKERVRDLLSRLTVEEKIGLLSTHQLPVERLGIGEWYVGQEVARGYVSRDPEEPSTVFPQPIGLASTFDPNLMEQLGGAPKILNLDIEGMEMEILRSIDFDKYRPTAMIIEMIPYSKQLVAGQKNQEILRFMQEKGYVEYAFTGINSIFLDMKFYEKVTGVSLEK